MAVALQKPRRISSRYNIEIRDEDGNDASHRLTIMHHRLTQLENPKAQKRDISTPIDQCPSPLTGWIPFWSQCEGPQAWVIRCDNPMPPPMFSSLGRGECKENEICVNDTWDPEADFGFLEPRASCVSKNNFVKISQMMLDGATAENEHIPNLYSDESLDWNDFRGEWLGNNATPPRHFVSAAVLTAGDGKTAMMAKNLTIQALTTTPNRLALYEPLANGTSQCLNCGRVEVDPVPGNTTMMQAQVVLETVGAVGIMFLATISMG